jgi:hypothetical protein
LNPAADCRILLDGELAGRFSQDRPFPTDESSQFFMSENPSIRARQEIGLPGRRRGTRLARRDERACCWYLSEEQRSQAGWIGGEMARLFLDGP